MMSRLLNSAALLAGLVIPGAWTQDVSLDWSSVATGGTISSPGYTLSGTIGQPTIARVHSRDFTIDGGYWSIFAAVQEPGAPFLSVRLTETNTVVVSWPITWPGFLLLENHDLNTTNWSEVMIQPIEVAVGDDRLDKQVIVPKPVGNRFYRLHHQ